MKVGNLTTLIGMLQQIEYTLGFYLKRAHSLWGAEYIIGGAFGAFRKKLFDKIGYLDTQCKTEDIEFSTRIQSVGKKIFFAEDAIVYTEGASTLKGLFKQRMRWKKGRFDTFIKHRKLFFSTKPKHNQILTQFLMPIALIFDFELTIEPIIMIIVFSIVLRYGNYGVIYLYLGMTTFLLVLSYFFGSKKNNLKTFLLAPIFGLLSYILTICEVYAFWGSVLLFSKGHNITWQDWKRKGIQNV